MFNKNMEVSMRAVRVTRLDGPEAVEILDVAEPADPGMVMVEVHAAGVAYPDVLLSRGLYQYRPELPFTMGSELAGVVRSAPEGAQVCAGDRVVALSGVMGAMAEVAAVSPAMAFPLPDNVSMTAGAGLLFNDLTMHFALAKRGQLREGETVLVHGAAGGIGTSALRLAGPMGAGRTIAVVSTHEKAEVAREAGASDVVLTDNWLAEVKELTGGRGVDIVVDPVGGDRFTDSLRSLARGGRVLVLGFTGGEIPTVKVNRLLLNNVDVRGVGWGSWFIADPGYLAEQWAQYSPMLASGTVPAPKPVVYPLERAAQALAAVENRAALGKLVIEVRS
jgi:NADPH2:quinone reductase